MTPDLLLYGCTQTAAYHGLAEWARSSGVHEFVPDFHRLQLEHWIWSKRAEMGARILDVGVIQPRRWLGEGYVTFGEHTEDVTGDLLSMPFEADSFDGVILTEVLEHCINPMGAIADVLRVLKPGGLLLVTSPFFWPTHDVEGEYKDYWRFTRQGWELMLAAFTDVTVTACAWTSEGRSSYDLMRRFECLGLTQHTEATTGYLCEARKP